MKAAKATYPGVQTTSGAIHSSPNTGEGLATAHNDKDDRTIKVFSNMIIALASVPVRDVKSEFLKLRDDCPDELSPVIDYCERHVRHWSSAVELKSRPSTLRTLLVELV